MIVPVFLFLSAQTISRFYRFCAVTAQQHEEAQHFLRDQRRPEAVSLVSECAVSLDFLLRYLSLKMVSRVAPPLHAARARVAFNYTAEFVKPITAVFSTGLNARTKYVVSQADFASILYLRLSLQMHIVSNC